MEIPNYTPEERRILFEALAEDCREKIRAGDEAALWEYIDLQWPDAVFDDFQRDIISSGVLGGIKEIAIKGCTSPGKGFAVATLVNVWFDVFWQGSKVILTSNNIEHAERVMFGEVTVVRLQMKYPRPCKVMTTEFQDTKQHYLIVANPKSGEAFSGQHGPATLFIFDEASGTPDMLYENAKQQAKLIVALSNPRTLSGWFRELYRPAEDPDVTQTIITPAGPRRLFTVGGMDCRNVREKRLKEPFAPLGGIDIQGRHFNQGEKIPNNLFLSVKAAIPNQMDYAKYAETMALPDEFRKRVFGEGKFPKEDAETQLFLQSWMQRHRDAWTPDVPVEAFGLDLAASESGDETILAAGGLQGLRRFHACQKANTMEVIGWVKETVQNEYGIDLTEGRVPIAVDEAGIGKTVCDKMEEDGILVIRVRGNASPLGDKDHYANRRAEVYGEFSRRMDPKQSEEPFAIPPDEVALEQELCAHHKIQLSRGFRVTPKDRYPGQQYTGHVIKETLGRSPDRSDAVVYLWDATKTLDVSGIPVLKRPLLILTPEEIAEVAAAEQAEKDKRPEAEVESEKFQAEVAELLGWESNVEEGTEVPFPSFL